MLFNKNRNLLFLSAIVLLVGLGSQSAQAGPILANSVDDWLAATLDGIDENGNAIVAGSSQDAAQQGHAAASNGIWNYKGTNGPGSGPFSGGLGLLTGWDNAPGNPSSAGCYKGGLSFCRMSATSMAPLSTFTGVTYAVREWVGSDLAGESLRISGSFDTLLNTAPVSPFNNGIHAVILLNSFVLFDQLIFPGAIASFDFVAANVFTDPRIRFAVGPIGPGPSVIGSQDFFNDRTRFAGQIELVTSSVPEPEMLLLLLSGLMGMGLAGSKRSRLA